MHAKTRTIPWGPFILAVATLVLALVGGIALSAALANPAHASTSYLHPAMVAAKAIRPQWDGRSPVFWTHSAEPMCRARYAGRIGIALDNHTANPFAMECKAEGDSGPWSWTVLGTRDGHSLDWSQVRAYCHQAGCKRPTAAMLTDLGLSPHVRAWMHVASTSAIYVRQGKNGVTVYVS